ncbi:unnamed protein product [Ectocarpus sp. CCAP 1310/34]|nr:unnamed protein product [Ectocarpus sp. CCAP 1310/34]
MSTVGGASSKRSSSTTRSSRRATLGIGSLSPERFMRTAVFRERNNDGAVKAKETTKASKGPTRTQQMQFAFGSKIIKPSSTGSGSTAGMGSSGAVMPTRGRTTTTAHRGGAVAADTSSTLARSRRERAARHDNQDQQPQQSASSRGRGAVRAEKQQPLASTTRQESDHHHHHASSALKVQLEEKESVIAELRRQLEAKAGGGDSGVKGPSTLSSASDTSKQQQQSDELNEGEQAALRAVQEEARADAEEKLSRVEAVTSAGLASLSEMQDRVDEMIRGLKARRSQ